MILHLVLAMVCGALISSRAGAVGGPVAPPRPYGPVPSARQLRWHELGTYAFLPDYRAQPRHPGAAERLSRQVGSLLAPHCWRLLGGGILLRLARWALANDYGVEVPSQSPTYKSMEKQGNKIVLTFDHVDGGFRPFDVNEPRGFSIAGSDRKFVQAQAKVAGPDKIEVWSEKVSEPVAVRCAWADNPVCNLYSGVGLPTTPFRTDDWPGVTINNKQ